MAEPNTEWGKDLKAAVGDLKDSMSAELRTLNGKVDDAQRSINDVNRRIDDVHKRIDDPNTGIYTLINNSKDQIVTRLEKAEDDTKLIPGVRLLVGLFGAVIAAIIGIGTYSNISGLASMNGRLDGFQKDITRVEVAANQAKISADAVAAETAKLTTSITEVRNDFKSMDARLNKGLDQFDEKLKSLGEKIDKLDDSSVSNDRLKKIEIAVDSIQQTLSFPRQRSGMAMHLTEFRSLKWDDRLAEPQKDGLLIGLDLPEGLNPQLLEDASATVPSLAVMNLPSNLKLTTGVSMEQRKLLIRLFDADVEALQGLLNAPEGLRVIVNYKIGALPPGRATINE